MLSRIKQEFIAQYLDEGIMNIYRIQAVVLLAVMWSMCGLAGCENPAQCPEGEICDCPPPYAPDIGFGYRIPSTVHSLPALSPDGKLLAFSTGSRFAILDLASGQLSRLPLRSHLPDNVRLLEESKVLWCPYDPGRVLVHCVTSTDTVGDGKRYEYGQNIYIVSLDGSEFQRVTPAKYGDGGAARGLGVYAWLAGSTVDNDSICGSFSPIGYYGEADTSVVSVYVLQNNVFAANTYDILRDQSFDGQHYISTRRSGSNQDIFVDGKQLQLPRPISLLDRAGFSPDGRKIALTVRPRDDPKWREIWIVDVEAFLRGMLPPGKIHVINLQRRFCTYSIAGLHAEYISDSTLAVSMYKDGDTVSPLWEITDDGRLVRQLTFAP